jgi:hypothetical protein
MTVSQLLQNTDSNELSEWQAYIKMENRKLEDAKTPTTGKVTAAPTKLSEAIKAQLAPKKKVK